MILAEIGSALLCLTASIESIVYVIFTIGSMPLLLFSSKPLNFSIALLSSSVFTFLWNAGNVTVFNPFTINALTHESFARYSFDYWPRGEIFKVGVFFIQLAMILSGHSSSGRPIDLLRERFLRKEDKFYISHLVNSSQLYLALVNHPDVLPVNQEVIKIYNPDS